MNEITIKHWKDVPAYAGPHAIPGIRFRAARQALGIEAWGMNVLELDPHCEGYPEHDHLEDGQEEVYVVLEGELEFRAGGERRRLRQGDMVSVPPQIRRHFATQEQGATLLAIGGARGKAYEPAG